MRFGHRHQRGALRAAARLPEDRDAARVAAELLDVVAHPAQREDEVEDADVAGVGELVAAELRQIEVPERVETMVDGDDDDVATAAEIARRRSRSRCWCRCCSRPGGTTPSPAASPRSRSAGVQTLRCRQSSLIGRRACPAAARPDRTHARRAHRSTAPAAPAAGSGAPPCRRRSGTPLKTSTPLAARAPRIFPAGRSGDERVLAGRARQAQTRDTRPDGRNAVRRLHRAALPAPRCPTCP